jgi:hypothetical protein
LFQFWTTIKIWYELIWKISSFTLTF